MEFLSKFSKYAENAIEEENATVEKLLKEGKRITRLNIGDPVHFFPTPKYMIDSYVEALRQGKTSYVDPEGVQELREAVAARYRRLYSIEVEMHDVFVTNGVSEALLFLNSMLIDPEDRVVVFRPYYSVCYTGFKLFGAVPILQDYQEEKDWELDTDELDRRIRAEIQAGKRVKYLSITNPSNPTGNVLDRKVLERIVDIARKNSLVIISDEIYDEIVFSGVKFTSISQVAKEVPYIIFNGASKGFDATGYRIGFVVIPGKDKVSEAIKRKLIDFCAIKLCVNTPAQYSVAEGLNNVKEHTKEVTNLVKSIEERAGFAAKRINESEYMHVVPPRGAYYLLPKLNMEKLKVKDDREFVHKLLEEDQVLLTRGSGFGADNHIRIVALPPKEILESSINRINDFCRRHSR